MKIRPKVTGVASVENCSPLTFYMAENQPLTPLCSVYGWTTIDRGEKTEKKKLLKNLPRTVVITV